MNDLEKKSANLESEGKKGVDGGKQEEIAKTINAPRVSEEKIKEKISNIDNEKIKSILLHCLSEQALGIDKIDEECDVYNKEIKPKLEDNKMSDFFNYLLSKNIKLLPSRLLKELNGMKTIKLTEDLIDKSLAFTYPSAILDNIDIYTRFLKAKDSDEKEIISRYINEKSPLDRVCEEYDSYLRIKNYKYEDGKVKELVLSLIKEGEHPTLVETYIPQISKKDVMEAESYIRGALNLR